MHRIDFGECLRRFFKYMLMGLAISVCNLGFIKRKTDMNEIITLGAMAAALFGVVDFFLPAVSTHLNQGVGLGLGFGLTM